MLHAPGNLSSCLFLTPEFSQTLAPAKRIGDQAVIIGAEGWSVPFPPLLSF
jgi:hypothetical protein